MCEVAYNVAQFLVAESSQRQPPDYKLGRPGRPLLYKPVFNGRWNLDFTTA